MSEILQSANIDTCSCSESDDSAAAIGGVVVAVSVISALTVIAIVVLVLRSRRRSYSTNDRYVTPECAKGSLCIAGVSQSLSIDSAT